MKLLGTILMLTLLTGCSSIDMKSYNANEPRLDLFDYFSGSTRGWGIVQDRKGELTRQFVVVGSGRQPCDGDGRMRGLVRNEVVAQAGQLTASSACRPELPLEVLRTVRP